MFIREVILCTDVLPELRTFYGQTLGLEITGEDHTFISVKTVNSVLTFKATTEIRRPFYHFAFNIPENKFDQAKQWVLQKTGLIKLDDQDEFDFRSWNAHSFYFYDLAGNIVEFIARHGLRKSSQSEFSGQSILEISEIGLPVRSVVQAYEELNRHFDIPDFSGDKQTFCAAGDDNGLFILVPEGRKWFPDCGEAEIFPTEIRIDSYENRIYEFEDLPYKIISTGK